MSRLAFSPREGFQRRIASGDASLRLYAILDLETCIRRGFDLFAVARAWREAGVALIQYRDKQGSDAVVLSNALKIRSIFQGTETLLILNDRVHLFAASGFHSVHVGQTDAGTAKAREAIGPGAILGMSTHSPRQVAEADGADIDYVAIGPVYGTQTKLDADPIVGLEGVRMARSLTAKPLVAIGGIERQTAGDVLKSGADSVAVISSLLPRENTADSALTETARDFLASFK
jgi:thiamine-phosphate pyrophosphorylase